MSMQCIISGASSASRTRAMTSHLHILRSTRAHYATLPLILQIPRREFSLYAKRPQLPLMRTYNKPISFAWLHSHGAANASAAAAIAKEDYEGEHGDITPNLFTNVKMHRNTLKAIQDVFKYEEMSKVQEAVLSRMPFDDDMFVKAKTGTGKTLAFLIPAIETALAKMDNRTTPVRRRTGNISILIVSPTRELAQQIADEASKLVQFHKLGVQCLVGGESKHTQLNFLQSRRADIVVGTPGRLNDFLDTVREFSQAVQTTKVLILDEADALLDMGFKDAVQAIVDSLPNDRQTLLFSATVSNDIRDISRDALKPSYQFIDCVDANDKQTNTQVLQSAVVAPYDVQLPLLRDTIFNHLKQPNSGKVMVFFPTTRSTQIYARIFDTILRRSSRIFELHSKKDQRQRTRISNGFRKASRGSVLFTSDVSARGIDYPDVTLVIQVGMPSSREQYIHRVGRTGRAGKEGEALMILAPFEEDFVHQEISDIPITLNDLPVLESSDPKFEDALKSIDEEDIEEVYLSYLGYYTSRIAALNQRRISGLQHAEEYISALGATNVPHLSPTMLKKMGLDDSSRGGKRGSFSRSGSRSNSRERYGGRDNGSSDRFDRESSRNRDRYGDHHGDRYKDRNSDRNEDRNSGRNGDRRRSLEHRSGSSSFPNDRNSNRDFGDSNRLRSKERGSGNNPSNSPCAKCGEIGHWARECPK